MDENNRTHTRPIGVLFTLEQILAKVEGIEDKIDDRLRKVETQIAAMWVTHGIMISVIIFLVTERLK